MYSYNYFGTPLKFPLFLVEVLLLPIWWNSKQFILHTELSSSFLISITIGIVSFTSFVIMFIFTSFWIPHEIKIYFISFFNTMVTKTRSSKKDFNFLKKLFDKDDYFGKLEALLFHKLQICSCLVVVGKMHWYELWWKILSWFKKQIVPMVPKNCVLIRILVVLVFSPKLHNFFNNLHEGSNFKSLLCPFM